jgi:hypothetical protein
LEVQEGEIVVSIETLPLLNATFRQNYNCVRNIATSFATIGKYLTIKFLKGSLFP